MRSARRVTLPALLLVLAACGDDRISAPSGIEAVGGGPSSVISDGTRANGNGDFFFLPPLLPNPSGDTAYDAGAFNGNWKPVVRICRLATPTTCETDGNGAPIYVRSYTGSAVTVSTADEHYQVNVDTRESWATTGSTNTTYRAHVFLPRREPVLLGFVDIVLAANQQAFRSVNSTELVPMLDGRTIPLKFRIEDGASAHGSSDYVEVRVTDAGGTFMTESNQAGIAIQPGWLPEGLDEVMLTIERVTPVAGTNDCHFGALPPWVRQYENCIQIETSPHVGIIQADAVVGMCTEAPAVEGQVMYKSDPAPGGRRIKALPNDTMPAALAASLECGSFGGLALVEPRGFTDHLRNGVIRLANGIGRVISPRPLYAIDFGEGGHLRANVDDLSHFGWGVPTHVHAAAGDNQVGAFGALLPDTLRIRVSALHAHNSSLPDPIAKVPVTFTVTGGGGTIVQIDDSTDANGYARALWTLGPSGTQTVTATIPSDSTNNATVFDPEWTATFSANIATLLFSVDEVSVTSVSMVHPDTVDVDAVPSITLTAIPSCSWSSSNTSVFTVNATSGTMFSVAAGSATLNATCGSITGSLPVTVAPAPVAAITLYHGSTNVTGTTQYVDTDFTQYLGIVTSGTGPGGCSSITSDNPTVLSNVTNTLTANAPGTATVTVTCGTTTASVTYVVTAAPVAGVDSIRVTYPTSQVVGSANTALIWWNPYTTAPSPTTFTAQPWSGGTVHPSPSCSYLLTNPPSASVMSITASTATTVTVTPTISSPSGQPSQLAITCNGLTRTIAVTSAATPG